MNIIYDLYQMTNYRKWITCSKRKIPIEQLNPNCFFDSHVQWSKSGIN